jgi:hypothetical protein
VRSNWQGDARRRRTAELGQAVTKRDQGSGLGSIWIPIRIQDQGLGIKDFLFSPHPWPIRLPHHLDERQRDRGKHGPQHQAEHAEHLQASKHREEDEQLVQPRAAADEARRQEVVDRTDHHDAPRRQQQRLDVAAGEQQIQRGRHPHEEGARHRDHRAGT